MAKRAGRPDLPTRRELGYIIGLGAGVGVVVGMMAVALHLPAWTMEATGGAACGGATVVVVSRRHAKRRP